MSLASHEWPGPTGAQKPVAVAALVILAAGAIALAMRDVPDWRPGALFIIGALLGMTLYHAAFGFTSAWRKLITIGDTTGVRAQLVMLALATLLFAPVLAAGSAFGEGVAGAVAPAGVSVAVGAFLFGFGMQLGAGCGSGTLYTLGGGNGRMAVTLLAFCAGSFLASLHMHWWQDLPATASISLGAKLGWPTAVALQLGLFAILAWVLNRWHGGGAALRAADQASSPAARAWRWQRLAAGPWPLYAGAVALAVLNGLTLVVAGHAWSITWAFTLWPAKLVTATGWSLADNPFWSSPFQARALEASVFADTTSVMNFGIIIGALLAAALAGRFAPTLRVPWPSLLAAVIGGVLMGYGARIAYGCNIGAFFSGIASTSLHGWLWILAALPGCVLGVRLRPHFGLAP
ncbi:MAG: YeeE/YedE family protein [Alphaproteobacteria bacterium]